MLADKYKARKNFWRIPEVVLLGCALFGGSLGCLIGMYVAHHKTSKLLFSLSMLILYILQAIVLLLFYGS